MTAFKTALHVFDLFVWDRSVFTQYGYYRDFFRSGPASHLRDRHRHVWVRYIDTTKITVWCMSSILIHMPNFSVYTISISEHYRSIVSYSPTPVWLVNEILWNITIAVWCLCEIVQFLISAVIMVNSFVRGQHRVLGITIVTCECAISILRKLRFGVCHRY